ELSVGGVIAGVVTDEQGTPIADVCVDVFDASGGYATGSLTDRTGRYAAGGLQAGNHRVRFNECTVAGRPIVRPVPPFVPYPGPEPQSPSPSRSPFGYVTEWYHDAYEFDTAADVHVVRGEETAGIDEDLEIAGAIAGAVVADDGTALRSVCVNAYDTSHRWIEGTQTDDVGSYVLGRIRPGDVKLHFVDCTQERFVPEWYDDQSSFLEADPVAVVSGVLTRRIDASLTPRPVPDLAVTGLDVRRIPPQIDRGPSAPLGWYRQVDVTVENLGRRGSTARLEAWVRYESDGAIHRLGSATARLEPGASLTRTFDWNGLGSVGDATVIAKVCESDEEYNLENNTKAVKSFVLVGGTGLGMSPLAWYDYSFPCWDGPIVSEEARTHP
ncbi:MAG TPA: carboxypeptidase-like regulatory domain-containing protein, partial [Actinomycetota bacterium]|nr:carboxypeptidase-like regulatory domain-containing protein [Actinomycetota bacterium]